LLKNLAWALSILLLLATTSFSAGTPPSGRKLYKWVDEQGVTHYGDHIPPEYASQEQHVINSQGVETERIEAQRTPEQMAAEEKKRFEAEQKASRDKNLMNTYASVPEIERLRDQRLTLLADQISCASPASGSGRIAAIRRPRPCRIRWRKTWFTSTTISTPRKRIFVRSAARRRP